MTNAILIITIFCLISGLGKALRDTIAFHWERSIFSKIQNEKVRTWFKSDWQDRHRHPVWFLWDGWHFGDTLSYLGILLAMIFVSHWKEILFCAAFFGTFFQIFYGIIFLSRK